MKLGNRNFILLIFFLIFYNASSLAEDTISSSPLINLDELKPSFEEVDNSSNDLTNKEVIKKKKKNSLKNNSASAKFIGLDKITAKTSEIIVNNIDGIYIGASQQISPEIAYRIYCPAYGYY